MMLRQTANPLMLLLVLLHGLVGSWSCCACCLMNIMAAAVPAPHVEEAHGTHAHVHIGLDDRHEHDGAPCQEHDHQDCRSHRCDYRVHPPVESPGLVASGEHIAVEARALVGQSAASTAVAAFCDASSADRTFASALEHCARSQVWRI